MTSYHFLVHFLRLFVGLFLIAMVLGEYFLFTTAFGPFNFFQGCGMLAFPIVSYIIGKEVIG